MKILDNFLVRLGFFYICAVGKTTSVCFDSSVGYRAIKEKKLPVIYACWHGKQIFLIWVHRNENVHALVSKSKDGEYIAAIIRELGFNSVRGSSSRGGYEALAGMIEMAKSGVSIVFTPDGPRGPLHTVQPGVIITAQKSGLPVIPVGCALKKRYVVRNWDEFDIPFLFNKAAVCYGEPLYINSGDAIESKTKELEKAINLATARAGELLSRKKSVCSGEI